MHFGSIYAWYPVCYVTSCRQHQVDTTPVLCVEGLEVWILAWRLAILMMYFIVFLSLSRQMPRLLLKSEHNHFLPHSVQFINNQPSSNSTLYSVGYWQPFLHKPNHHLFSFLKKGRWLKNQKKIRLPCCQ
jgi:hypothetical protein